MSENVPHDIIAGDEAGDVPHDITVGDEASEKVQQDTVEAGGAAKEKEDQPTAPYEEETRTPQMLNVDQQEEVAGTITLKKTEHRNMEKLLFRQNRQWFVIV